MIKESKIIVIGKVLRIKEPIFHATAVATIEIEQIMVGIYEDKHIGVTYYPRSSIEARLLLNQRSIFFIGENNRIVKGYAGKIPIEKDKVEVLDILGEATSQTLKDFIQRIRDSKSRQELVADKSGSRHPRGDNWLT
jgi:hypothetical protein